MAGVSTVTGFAANVSSSVLSGLWNKVVQVVKMVISTPQAVADMEAQAQRLDNVIHGINEKLGQEQKPPKRIVKVWLDKADEAMKSSRSIGNEYQQHKNCLSCCPNCFCRYKISKRIIDWKVNVDRLHTEKQSDFPPNGEYGDFTPLTQIPIHIPSPGFVGDAIKSAQSKLEEWLTEDSNIRIIGVHGMGGVGKTSLLQNINNSQKVSSSFDLIIWVTVSQKYDISNLQDCIAKRLRLENFDKFNSEEREYRLCSCLKDKKCLLILDDMWKSLELQSLGVSLDESSCKIVLSTRNKEVCTRMGAKDIITVVPLSEEEAWKLFCSRAFGNESVPQEIEDIARGIAGECKGLPLAINVVAAAMTNYSSHEWKLCLSQIQNIDERFYGLHDEIEEELFQPLKWSYNGLQDYLKTCFLYFAAYPEDEVIEVKEVIDMWVAEGLVQGSGETYLPDIGHSYINHLRDRCLIEVVRNDIVGRVESVKIHDILRDLAILIAEKEHGCYFKAGQGLSHFPSEEDSEGYARMSLMKNSLHSLPTTFRCSSLSVLLLGENNAIEEVPGSFLNELRSLRVLDLSHTGITSLPPSIENLKHLASLQLKDTNISELPEIICDLKELQILNVSGCQQLRFLPERISELKSLRALNISNCSGLSHLPRGISKLVTLESLTMWGSTIRLDFEEEANAEERKYGCLKDLQSLRRLRVLHVQMKSPVKEGVMENWSKMRVLWLCFEGANQDYLPQDMQAMKDLESLSIRDCHVERLPSWVSEFRKLATLDFNRNLSWDGCRKKRILGGWKAFYSFQNRCREAELWDWKTTLTLFGLLVIPVILYGCELWASSTTDMQWKQIEKIQKQWITNKFKIKSAVPYAILLSETGAAPIEAIAMARVIRYLKKIEQMEEARWPKVVFSDRLCKRKKTWMQQNNKWLSKWGICLSMCPTKSKEIKNFVMDKFHKHTWEKELGRKKKYYIEEFNPTHNHQQKAYIGANISWRSKTLIAQLRTNSHQLRCETGRWKRPKERWEERVCILCSSGKVETEKHFILECEALKDSRENYAGILAANSWDNLFSEEFVEKLGAIIVKLHKKRAECKSQMEKQSVP